MTDIGFSERGKSEYAVLPDDQLPMLAAIYYERDFDINGTLGKIVR